MLLFSFVVGQEPARPSAPPKLRIDETLISRIGREDAAAFEELYLLSERAVYAYALSLLRSHEDAQDAVQDTYLKIRAAAHLYKPMGKPMAWIFTITRHLCMNRLRQRGKGTSAPWEDLENNAEFSYITDQEDRLVLLSVLELLDEEERSVVLLHAVSGWRHAEIARHLQKPLSTVLSKYQRALRKLRRHLEEQGGLF